MNITKKVDKKLNSYGLLICNMRIIYSECNFVMIPIIVDASGKGLQHYVKKLAFSDQETRKQYES